MKDPIKLKELILEKVDLSRLMLDDRVRFLYNPTNADEVQFHCPFHGEDKKPSARFYRSTNSCFCFKCKKAWDPVSYVMEKEGFHFRNALNHLITRYNVDISGISDDPEFKIDGPPRVSEANIRIISARNRIREIKGKVPLDRYRALCYAYYIISFKIFKGEPIINDINKLESKIG